MYVSVCECVCVVCVYVCVCVWVCVCGCVCVCVWVSVCVCLCVCVCVGTVKCVHLEDTKGQMALWCSEGLYYNFHTQLSSPNFETKH